MLPSTPQDDDRDPWGPDLSREIARLPRERASARVPGAVDTARDRAEEPGEGDEDEIEEIEIVPVRRQLSLAIAGFAALLAVGLILGAQTSGPDTRIPYAIVSFGVQLLFVLAWTMAMRPPAMIAVAAVCLLAGAFGDYLAVTTEPARLLPLAYVAVPASVVALIAQTFRAADRRRLREALGTTLVLVLGTMAFSSLVLLTRKPTGTQALLVCLAAAGVALVVGRLVDAFFAKPRIAAQVPRGASGVILGAMLGTLAAGALGSVLVRPFDPAKGAVLGVVVAGLAVVADLGVDFAEAGRETAGDAPTFWLARHMQGPLGAFALASAAAYALTIFYLT